uniref:NADH dehydrogenase subunit 4L n=1 Tax=Strongyloides papillosus TaxID=174720 RepID=A0A0N5BWW4_STREA
MYFVTILKLYLFCLFGFFFIKLLIELTSFFHVKNLINLIFTTTVLYTCGLNILLYYSTLIFLVQTIGNILKIY